MGLSRLPGVPLMFGVLSTLSKLRTQEEMQVTSAAVQQYNFHLELGAKVTSCKRFLRCLKRAKFTATLCIEGDQKGPLQLMRDQSIECSNDTS